MPPLHDDAQRHRSSPEDPDASSDDVEADTDPLNSEPEEVPRTRRPSSRTVVARTFVLVYAAAIATAVLIPNPHAIETFKSNVGMLLRPIASGVISANPTQSGDVVMNIVAFIPLTVFLGIAWRRIPSWVCGIIGTVASMCAETIQYLIPALTRRPDIWNVMENSVGSWLGALIVAALRIHRPPARTGRANRQR
ncbi:MAG: VanZ family protein [Acidipropionibacterium acidipropionici]|uniref:VanZ family protein n=1 Tax=Acidipropionibacterium acidipropionici TaxID=1748 RepID=UPI002F35B95E